MHIAYFNTNRPFKYTDSDSLTIEVPESQYQDDGLLNRPITEHDLLLSLQPLVEAEVGRVVLSRLADNAAPMILEVGMFTVDVTQKVSSSRWETETIKLWIVPPALTK